MDEKDIEPANIGDRVENRFLILERVGEGGMGVVYLAQDTKASNRRVVLKFPKKELHYRKGFRSRFAAEIQSLIAFEHPHVVRVYEQGSHNGLPFMVLPYLSGGTLAQRVARSGPQSVQELLAWLPRVAGALDALHATGIIHRDVKAANILFDGHGEPHISDFGIAKVLYELGRAEGTRTETGMGLGSPESLAPEFLDGSYTPAYDQYGLGNTIYFALSGRLPFTADSQLQYKLSTVTPPSLLDAAPQVGAAVSAAVMKALSREPTDRYGSCRELVQALTSVSSSGDRAERPGPTAAAPEPPRWTAPPPPPPAPAPPPPLQQEAPLDPRVQWLKQYRRPVIGAAVGLAALVVLLFAMNRKETVEAAESLAAEEPAPAPAPELSTEPAAEPPSEAAAEPAPEPAPAPVEAAKTPPAEQIELPAPAPSPQPRQQTSSSTISARTETPPAKKEPVCQDEVVGERWEFKTDKWNFESLGLGDTRTDARTDGKQQLKEFETYCRDFYKDDVAGGRIRNMKQFGVPTCELAEGDRETGFSSECKIDGTCMFEELTDVKQRVCR